MAGREIISDIKSAKTALRKSVLAARDALDPALRAAASATIAGKLAALPAFASARTVMAYAGFGSEIDTAPFLAATLAAGKTLVLPRVDRATRTLQLFVVRDPAADLVAGIWGIREPDPARCAVAEPDTIDFVLVPAVAFTQDGDRLGYGGGFYDQLIQKFRPRPLLITAGFALQLQPAVPVEDTDQRVAGVITDRATYGAAAA